MYKNFIVSSHLFLQACYFMQSKKLVNKDIQESKWDKKIN